MSNPDLNPKAGTIERSVLYLCTILLLVVVAGCSAAGPLFTGTAATPSPATAAQADSPQPAMTPTPAPEMAEPTMNPDDGSILSVFGFYGSDFANGLATEGDSLYVVSGGMLSIFDAAEMAHPRLVSLVELPPSDDEENPVLCLSVSHECPLVVEDGYAYLRTNTRELHVLDVQDPAQPQHLGRFWLGTRHFAVQDKIVYAVGIGLIQIIDLTDPAQPERIATLDWDGGGIAGLVLQDGKLYVAEEGESGPLKVYDVSQMAAPTLVGRYEVPTSDYRWLYGLVVNGDVAYIMQQDELLVLDVSNIAQIALIDAYPDLTGDFIMGDENALYILRLDGDGDENVGVVDISDPANLELTGAIRVDYFPADGVLMADGRHLFLENMQALDVTDPAQPVIVSSLVRASDDLHDIFMSQGLAYLVAQNSGVDVMDLSDPRSLTRIGRIWDWSGSVQHVAVVDDSTVALAKGYSDLTVFDISDLTQPEIVASYENLWEQETRWVPDLIAARGEIIYMAQAEDPILWSLDISAPDAERATAVYTADGGILRMLVVDDLLYLAAGDAGLVILDIADPSAVTLLGSYDSVFAVDVLVDQNLAYIYGSSGLEGQAELHIIDVSDPATLKLIGSYRPPPDADEVVEWRQYVAAQTGVAIDGDRLYMSAGEAGLWAIDVSDPTLPMRLDVFPMNAWGVAVHQGLIYAVDWETGLYVLDEIGHGDEVPFQAAAFLPMPADPMPQVDVPFPTPTPLPPLESLVTGEIDSELAQEQLEAAITALEAADVETALAALDEALAADPTLVDAYFYRGVALTLPQMIGFSDLEATDAEQAVVDFTRVINAQPDRAEAYWLRAYTNSVWYLSSYESIQSDLDRVTELGALGGERAMLQAMLLWTMAVDEASDESSLPLMLETLDEYPKLTKEYYFLWLSLIPIFEGDLVDPAVYPDLLAVANARLAEAPDNADAFAMRGLVHLLQDDEMQASADFNQFFTLAEDFVDLWWEVRWGGVAAREPFERDDPLAVYRRAFRSEARNRAIDLVLYIDLDLEIVELSGSLVDNVYVGPEGLVRIQVPPLFGSNISTEDEFDPSGYLGVRFSDDVCQLYILMRGLYDLGDLSLGEALDDVLPGIGTEDRITVEYKYGPVLLKSVTAQGQSPCVSTTIVDGEVVEEVSDAQVVIAVFHHQGYLYLLQYGIGDNAMLPVSAGDPILIERMQAFLDGIEILTE